MSEVGSSGCGPMSVPLIQSSYLSGWKRLTNVSIEIFTMSELHTKHFELKICLKYQYQSPISTSKDPTLPAITLECPFAILHPAGHCEIGRLSAIESMIVTGMVSERECDDDLARFLCHL